MSKRKEFNSPTFAANPRFGYLPEADKYLFRSAPPRHAFNVIGVGVNGQEQMLVTLLEGRATIHGVYDPNPGSIERAKALLRQGMSVTDACVAVGCTSLGSFSSRFTEIVGETPSRYRARDHRGLEVVRDDSALQKAVDDALAANPDIAEKIRGGKVQAAGKIVGDVMKATRGQADAARVQELVLAAVNGS